MRKMTALLIAAGLVLVSISIANGHSDWAKYQFIEVPDYVNVPEEFIYTAEDFNDGLITEDQIGTVNCCGCHWNTKHAGPGQGFCD